MNRDFRALFLLIGLPAFLLAMFGLLALMFGVGGLGAETRQGRKPNGRSLLPFRVASYAEQHDRYERKIKSRMASRAKAFLKTGEADRVWGADDVPWGTNVSARVKYGYHVATNGDVFGWARLDDNRVIGCRMEPFRYEDQSGLYLIAMGAVLVMALFVMLFACAWMLARSARRTREELAIKDSFLDMISHELCTPLGSIVPLASALAENGIRSDARRQEALDTIRREAARMSRMIDELLTVVRLRNGKLTFAQERVNLSEAAERAAAVVRVRYPDCAIRVTCEGAAVALADRDKVEQVAINLIENACRHSGSETVEVSCRATPFGCAQIEVADRADEIPVALRNRIFDRFYQTPGASGGGLGLGLNIVAGFVRGMHGKVRVRPRADAGGRGGNAFLVDLPAAPEEEMKHG